MKKRIILALAILVGATVADFTADNSACMAVTKKTSKKSTRTSSKNSNYTKYVGTVGKYKVTMFLDKNWNGYYYYGNGSKGNLKLKGEFQGGSAKEVNYYLYEYNSSGECTAVWDMNFGAFGTYGTMTTNGKTYDVTLKEIF